MFSQLSIGEPALIRNTTFEPSPCCFEFQWGSFSGPVTQTRSDSNMHTWQLHCALVSVRWEFHKLQNKVWKTTLARRQQLHPQSRMVRHHASSWGTHDRWEVWCCTDGTSWFCEVLRTEAPHCPVSPHWSLIYLSYFIIVLISTFLGKWNTLPQHELMQGHFRDTWPTGSVVWEYVCMTWLNIWGQFKKKNHPITKKRLIGV